MIVQDLGIATAYGYAKSKGYTGTEEEFALLMASYATVAEEAAESASQAEESATNAATSASSASQSATTASTAATSASTSAQTATTKAGEASTSASNAATSASSASSSATSASTSAQTATSAAESASASATAAEEAAESINEPDTTLTIPGRAADAKAVGDAIAAVDIDTVNNARQLLSENYVLDQEPYLFRASGGDGADRVEECIVGGSVGWNQLCNSASVTVTSGHKYISKVGSTWTVGTSTGSAITGLTSGTDMIIDLTTLFGSTIADYIYSLEQATAGAGVAWFRKYFPEDYYEYCAPTLKHVEGVSAKEVVGRNLFDAAKAVHNSNVSSAGTIFYDTNYCRSDYIPVIYGEQYYVSVLPVVISFKADKTFNRVIQNTPNAGLFITNDPNDAFVIIRNYSALSTTQAQDDAINTAQLELGSTATTYAPYHKNIYPLDSTLTLRGIPKLADGKMCFDGDKYLPSGQVERNTVLRAYQSGDESLANAITDGTNTVVSSANASTETATPYTALQTLDPHGTEEFVSTGIVPVGHESKYLENLRAKIEGLPKDFSTLIAPTEQTYKATRNYTVGSLLIVDNVLYKVTSAIANGGNITPNTNCTATTLAAVIAAL